MFHRVDDIYAMPGPQFFAFAYRIAAYDGMLARRVQAQAASPAPSPARSPAPVSSAQSGTQQQVSPQHKPLAAMAFSYPDLFERVRVPAPTE